MPPNVISAQNTAGIPMMPGVLPCLCFHTPAGGAYSAPPDQLHLRGLLCGMEEKRTRRRRTGEKEKWRYENGKRRGKRFKRVRKERGNRKEEERKMGLSPSLIAS